MEQIFKYPIEVTDEQTIKMPEDAQILTVQTQRGAPCIWAKVDESKKMTDCRIRTFGTGHNIPEGFYGKYIGTYQLKDGNLVFHVFDNSPKHFG